MVVTLGWGSALEIYCSSYNVGVTMNEVLDQPKLKTSSQLSEEIAELYSIGDMARAYKVSLRTLRFYEDRQLLSPHRLGNARYYDLEARRRLETILKAKKLGFTLTEISEILGSGSETGLQLRPEQVSVQIGLLERQLEEIEMALNELRSMQKNQGSGNGHAAPSLNSKIAC